MQNTNFESTLNEKPDPENNSNHLLHNPCLVQQTNPKQKVSNQNSPSTLSMTAQPPGTPQTPLNCNDRFHSLPLSPRSEEKVENSPHKSISKPKQEEEEEEEKTPTSKWVAGPWKNTPTIHLSMFGKEMVEEYRKIVKAKESETQLVKNGETSNCQNQTKDSLLLDL